MLNEGNQIHNFISSSGSGTVINYGSGSDFLTSYGSGSTSQQVTVPVLLVKKLRFLRCRFLNAALFVNSKNKPRVRYRILLQIECGWDPDKLWTRSSRVENQVYLLILANFLVPGSGSAFLIPVLRIHDILGWIRIRILGSMPLTNGSGFGFRSGSWIRILLFSSWTFKMPAKNLFF